MDANARAAQVARASYGRLVALLAARSGDIAGAEESLSDAFLAALETWPKVGTPNNPEAWLMAAAKNRTIDRYRRNARSPVTSVEDLPNVEDDMQQHVTTDGAIPDKRLALMFVCAHPAIDASVHTPLMLQTVLGFEAAEIGRSFLVSPSALAQRLVRAKRKIKDTRIAFEIPDQSAMAERLGSVLEAVYGAYALDWLHEPNGRDMSEEAAYLSRILAQLLPQEAEVLGCAALIAYAHGRRRARVQNGRFIPLQEQDTALWDVATMAQANGFLLKAASLGKMGRFQLEAAIQQAHIHGVETGTPDWQGLLHLSDGLSRLWPTTGAAVNRAAIVGEVVGPEAGLALLDTIAAGLSEAFQPLAATRAHLLSKLARTKDARRAYDEAIELTTEPLLRQWLQEKCDGLPGLDVRR
jgi:RNA polymerase sigma-70 factor, ECF subfamily